eukprot:s1649_g15.t1
MELPRKCSWLGVQYVFGIGVTWGNHFHIFPHIAMKSLAMALCTLLGLVMALVIMVSWHSESLWQEPSWGRNLRATDIIEIFPKFDVHSLNKVIPGKCLRQQLEKELKWMWWVACDSLEKHWVALLSCFALAAALCAVRQWDSWDGGYRLVQQVVDEDQIGDMKGLHGKTAIIYTGCLWLLDMASDVYVIQAYYTQGMYVFAFLLIWIWVGSGLLAFVHRYLSWERCDYKTNIEFWAQGLNSDGQARPGVAVLALYLLQLEPFVVAYRSWNHGMTLQLREEKTLTAVCEGAPSALLQIYALLVIGPQGSPMILSGSIALSILTVAEGVNMGYELCLPEGKHAESHLPRVLLAGFRWCDVYWRISIWALLGMALRPIHGKRQGIQQPYLPFIMAFEFLLVCVVFKMGLQLRKWSDIFQKRYFVGCICCFLSTFVCSYDKGLVPQQRLSRTLVALRSVESLVTLCLCALIFSATLEGVCILTEEPALLTIALVTVFTSSLAMVFAAANDIALSCWALPLFPVISGLKGGRLELAARLGLASQIRQGSENVEYYVAALCQAAEAGHVSAVEACRCELDVPITSTLSTGETAMHFAAKGGQVQVMETLQAAGSQDLEIVDSEGQTPAWTAAASGHLDVLKFLQTSGCNLETANDDGRTPAFMAARNCHLEVLKFLRSSGCNLATANNEGRTPAWSAAANGHLEILKFLQISGCNLDTANNEDWTPAFVAAANGHLEVLKFLQSSGCNLEAANNNGSTPAWSAARWDHLDVLKFLQSSGYNLETPTSDGSTPTWCAARNGHLEVLKFLQSSGCNLETPNNDRETPALVAARYGHLEVLRFLQSSACNLEIADQDGDTPAWAAAQQGHLEVLKFLQSSGCSIHVSCLHTAVKRNRLELVEFLLSAVDVNAPGICGLRALDIARANDASSSVTEALVKAGATSAPTPQLVGLTALKPLEPPAHAYVWLTCGLPELAQSTGKFYHEIHLLSEFENPQLGWLSTDFIGGEKDGKGVGDDSHSWGFDGGRCGWWHDQKMEPLGISKWRVNDVLGFALDLDQGTMQLHTQQGEQITVPFQFQGALYPAVSVRGLFRMHMAKKSWKLQPPKGYDEWSSRDCAWTNCAELASAEHRSASHRP